MPDLGPESWQATVKPESEAAERGNHPRRSRESADDRKTNHRREGEWRYGVAALPFYITEKAVGDMAVRRTKEDAIKIVTSCAQKYKDELDGNTLMFVCKDKHNVISCFEFSFRPENFMHLTGLKTIRNAAELKNANRTDAEIISAADFYSRCLNHKLSPRDFEFANDGTTDMKLNVLPLVVNKNLSANMIGDYNSSKPLLYTEKLAGSIKACVGFTRDSNTGLLLPNTMLQEDLRPNVCGYVTVIATYRKKQGDEKYQELTYAAKKIDWSKVKLPAPFEYILLPKNG